MARKLGITQQRYSVLENSSKIPEEREKEILALLNYSKREADKLYALVLPPPAMNGKIVNR